MVWLKKNFEVIPLKHALEKHRGTRVAITFDDGYADNAGSARDILESEQLPATVFVTEAMVGSQRLFWWDELDILLHSTTPPRNLEIEVGGRTLWISIADEAAKTRAYVLLHRELRLLPPNALTQLLERVRLDLEVAAPTFSPSFRPLSAAELIELGSSPLIEIGSHTLSHPLLKILPKAAQRSEIVDSKTNLEHRLGESITSLSYPFGGRDSFDTTTVECVNEAGYAMACANIPGLARSRAERFFLPRHLVRDWDRDQFARMVRNFVTTR